MCPQLLQSSLTLCNPMDYSPPSSSVHGILQARTLQWVAMPSSKGSSQSRDRTCISKVSCFGRWVLYHSHHLGSPQGRRQNTNLAGSFVRTHNKLSTPPNRQGSSPCLAFDTGAKGGRPVFLLPVPEHRDARTPKKPGSRTMSTGKRSPGGEPSRGARQQGHQRTHLAPQGNP